MIEEAFSPGFDFNNVIELWPNYKNVENLYLKNYDGTNIKSANILLDSILENEEKEWLEKLFFGSDGWYRYTDSKYSIAIKLAAMSLGLTNNVFTIDVNRENEIKKEILSIPRFEQKLTARCYLKQKVATYFTMKNYLKIIKDTEELEITLYRGMANRYDGTKYLHKGMESWTLSLEKAMVFAGEYGFVIEKRYSLYELFAGFRSTYKNMQHNIYRNNGFFVRREHEIIVENMEEIYDCSGSNHIILSDVYY